MSIVNTEGVGVGRAIAGIRSGASWRAIGSSVAAAVVAVGLIAAAPATTASAESRNEAAQAVTIDGANAFPESVASDGRFVYTTSIADGTVYRGRLGAPTLEPFLRGGEDGRTQATGVKIAGDRLLVAGGFTGRFFIYTSTGKLVGSYSVPDTGEKTLVNDEAIAPDGDVYITDSFRAVVYRIPAAQVQALPGDTHRTLQVAYRLPDYISGQSNGNGIVMGPDGRSLIIGYWYSGALYRLDLATGGIRKISAPALPSADGIVRQGNTLYIARSVDNEITTVRLSADDTGTVVSERTFTGADTTTGVAIAHDRLLVTNSQMDTYLFGTPLTSRVFSLEELPLH
ncbi:SMP-30/gluconolactonase/LRE family protein [Leifsonia sp. AG29]|uniref:SMP-30/gluconolactonase/LRE family protein n=1 Tax=Leifsonia sp. AG29 TaxID=2598860 RepID=UPI00131A6D52|nr:hypothetical protein [Leifsonia sp. AG29]